jgi:hypothetical protein
MRLAFVVEAGRDAPADARGLVDVVTFGAPDEFRFAARLLVSELVANAVRHAGDNQDTIRLQVEEIGTDILRVEVIDGGPGFTRSDLTNGQRPWSGLAFVNALSTCWDVETTAAGTCVWFELAKSAHTLAGRGSNGALDSRRRPA